MSVWITEELMRRCFRFRSRTSVWQQSYFRFPTKHASLPSQRLAHIWSVRPSRTCPAGGLVGSLRFYWDADHSGEPQRGSLPAELRTGSASAQKAHISPFRDQLQHCVCPSDVLDLAVGYVLTAHEVSWSLSQMWITIRVMTIEQTRYELQLMFQHPAFDELLQRAVTMVGQMQNSNLAYSLISMVRLGVPQQSRVVQTFLRACQENLNGFNETSLSILASCLALMEESPNVAGLKEGMRLVVKARLPTITNVTAVQTMMHLSGKDCPPDLKQKLEEKVLSMADQFDIRNGCKILLTMASMKFHSIPLLLFCAKMIREHMDEIPVTNLLAILGACDELLFRHLSLFADISDHVASTEMCSNKQLLFFMSKFKRLRFCPTALMEVFAETVISKPDTITRKDMFCILSVYAYFNYDLQQRRQPFLDSLTRVLDSYLPSMAPSDLLKVVSSLCVLGHFPAAPLQQLLHSSAVDTFRTAGQRPAVVKKRTFQIVDSCLRIDRPPHLTALSVPTFLLEDSPGSNLAEKTWLAQNLQALVKDQEGSTVQDSMVENFYFIDGVINKPSRPSVPGGSTDSGEERSPATCSQRIAVIWDPYSFCLGTSHPCGLLAVKIRHLKILGFDQVLALQLPVRYMSNDDRLNYLRRKIFPEHYGSDTEPEAEETGILS
ncbi:FAST kinase domain-containing protein 2, mitochondrial [Brachionichthys hirsutus]|uniref:FAST kinase domain-containing protein 2, mitochondrial n=1 Tax=Brachionichthys hirsutus TaxID=412623 RepID=UPI0036052E1A